MTEADYVAIGASEEEVPTYDSCLAVHRHQLQFHQTMNWKGGAADSVREVASPKPDKSVVVVIRKVPRFAAC